MVKTIEIDCSKGLHLWGPVPTTEARRLMRDLRWAVSHLRGADCPSTQVYGWVVRCSECSVFDVRVQLGDGTSEHVLVTDPAAVERCRALFPF